MALKNVPKAGPLTLTLKAQAANTTGPKFVKFYASDNAFFSICGAGEQAIGVLPSKADAGEPIAIQLAPSLSLVEAGTSVTAGDRVTSDADGNAIPATFGTKVNGIAYTGGGDGELITVKTVDPVDGAAVGGQIVDFGVATLVAGTKTVTNAKVASGDKILVSRVTPGGTVGNLSAPAASITAATSFVINSDSATETSTVAWAIVR